MSLKWGLVGASNVAVQCMVPSIMQSDSEIVCVSSNAPQDYVLSIAGAFSAAVTDSYKKVADYRPDIVYISSNNDLHFEQAKYFIENGFAVLCEKPVCLNLQEAVHLEGLIKKKMITFGVNHHLRFSKVHGFLKDLIASREFGRCIAINVKHLVCLPENLRTWRTNSLEVGGCLLDINTHNIDLVRFLTSVEIRHSLLNAIGLNEKSVDLFSASTSILENDIIVSFQESFINPGTQTEIEIFFTNGSVKAVNNLTQAGFGEVFIYTKNEVKKISIPQTNLYDAIVNEFQAAFKERRPHAVDINSGIASLKNALILKEQIEICENSFQIDF